MAYVRIDNKSFAFLGQISVRPECVSNCALNNTGKVMQIQTPLNCVYSLLFAFKVSMVSINIKSLLASISAMVDSL